MINLHDGELIDILPAHLKIQPEYQAISYALKRMWAVLHEYAAKVSFFSMIDDADEKILDVLAVEMNAQYYEPDFSIEMKRDIIKNSILWNIKSGTVFAVENILQIICGGGKEIEWYEYGGQPNHFKLNVNTVDIADFESIIMIIQKVKRKTARLDGMDISFDAEGEHRFGHLLSFHNTISIDMEQDLGYCDNEFTYYYTDEYDNILIQ